MVANEMETLTRTVSTVAKRYRTTLREANMCYEDLLSEGWLWMKTHPCKHDNRTGHIILGVKYHLARLIQKQLTSTESLHENMGQEMKPGEAMAVEELLGKMHARERQIVELLTEGKTYEEVGTELGISKARVGHIIQSIRIRLQGER